jgi:hypothetical protein
LIRVGYTISHCTRRITFSPKFGICALIEQPANEAYVVYYKFGGCLVTTYGPVAIEGKSETHERTLCRDKVRSFTSNPVLSEGKIASMGKIKSRQLIHPHPPALTCYSSLFNILCKTLLRTETQDLKSNSNSREDGRI